MEDDLLKRVAVLGAAGKMGSGISLLLLEQMALSELRESGSVGEGKKVLVLIDSKEPALFGLKRYLRHQIRRFAEKKINFLRGCYAENPFLVSNEEIITAFIEGALDIVRLETDVKEAKNAALVFEAIVEDVKVKAEVFSEIEHASFSKPFYFSNTSSIPIGVLSGQSGVDGRIIGFHFYNPPPVQRLLEVIPAKNTLPALVKLSKELAALLGKIIVVSNDAAGFIGNGHFMREIDFACRKVKELEKEYGKKQAIWMVNRVTQDFLIRPMGIFQLLDYVGLDVGQKVLGIMSRYLQKPFDGKLLEELLSKGVKGGQKEDGSQKEGIFQYEKGSIAKIWDEKGYVDLPKENLGALPEGHIPWKILHKEKERKQKLKRFFESLFASKTLGASLAKEFLLHSREIARGLVKDGVAESIEDVNTVLQNGFYHLYGADNEWIPDVSNAGRGI